VQICNGIRHLSINHIFSNTRTERILRDIEEVRNSDEAAKGFISTEMLINSLLELKAIISGPPETPYDGGVFHLGIKG